jgi:hypothetical protein
MNPPEKIGPSAPGGANRIFDRPPPQPEFYIIGQRPGWGWAAYLLPYLEQDALHRSINFEQPINNLAFQPVRTNPLPMYTCPSDRSTGVFGIVNIFGDTTVRAATNSYAACYGAEGLLTYNPDDGNGVFSRNSKRRIADITDGTSQTFLIGERSALLAQAPWAGAVTHGTIRTTPGAPVYNSSIQPSPAMPMARIGRKPLNDPFSEPYDFFSPHPGIVQFVFGDGSVQPVRTTTSIRILQALATRAGGEVADGY